VPIIMLTAKSEEIDKVLGLELGADDYITKPFSMREFRSRVKAALRRAGMARPEEGDEQPIEVLGLRIDPAKRTVTLDGNVIPTTFVEFEILTSLASNPGRVYTRDMLLSRVWGDSAYRDPRTIDVHIRHLREKLEADAKEPEYIFTVRGVGYRFRDTAEE
jgi:DNA-binding response OmpR family regulator